MPVITRRAQPQAKSYKVDEASDDSDDELMTFDEVFGHSNNKDADDELDFKAGRSRKRKHQGKQGSKKRNTKYRRAARAPSLSDMSDDEDRRAGDTPELEDYPVKFDDSNDYVYSPKAGMNLPQVLQIHVDATNTNGKAIINLNLADLIASQTSKASSITLSTPGAELGDGEDTLVEPDKAKHRGKRVKVLHTGKGQRAVKKSARKKSTPKGFEDLPYELRIGIYRQVFVKKSPLHFTSKESFSRSGQFLRTCKLVHEEGRAIMYGENAFHFSRSSLTRGTYFEAHWREIGFKDIRRFLEDIGPANRSLMKYITFFLTDAPPSITPYLEEEQRRCVNDPVLHHIFQLIGSQTTLNKFAVAFQVRRSVMSSDYVFLKALCSIKCLHFNQARKWWSTNRLAYGIMDRLQKMMVIKEEVDEDVDLSKKKVIEPEMYLD